MPDPAFIPLLPKHVHALTAARGPIVLNSSTYSVFLSSNGNVAPELFKCLAPLKAGGRLAGVVALGRRPGDALYEDSELDALDLLCSYVALAVQNHALTQTIAQRVSENLRLMASLHGFYDNALEAFATAIDVKHVNIHGHSLRVGRYAAAIGEAMGMEPSEVAALRSAGYLARHWKSRRRPPSVRQARSARSGRVSRNGGPHHRRPSDRQQRAVSVAQDSGDGALASRAQRWLRLSRSARSARRPADGGAHCRPCRLVRCHDQCSSLPRAAFGGQRAERSGPNGAGEISIRMSCRRLLIQVRRDAVGSNRTPLLDTMPVNIAATDIDHLAATLQHKVSRGKMYLTKEVVLSSSSETDGIRKILSEAESAVADTRSLHYARSGRDNRLLQSLSVPSPCPTIAFEA